MKKLPLFIFFALFALQSQAQTINDVPIKDINVEYLEITGRIVKLFLTGFLVEIQFGDSPEFIAKRKKRMSIKDAEGKEVQLGTMIDALNFMSANGYDFVTAYTTTFENESVSHYLLRKRK